MSPQEMKAYAGQQAKFFNFILQVMAENERLRQRVEALESENAALTDTLEQWKSNDEWSNRVTYDNVVDQIASLEDDCSYESIRKICTLSFMDYDPRRMDVVRVSKNDQGMFSQCREIAMKVAEELGNASLQRE